MSEKNILNASTPNTSVTQGIRKSFWEPKGPRLIQLLYLPRIYSICFYIPLKPIRNWFISVSVCMWHGNQMHLTI